MHGKAYLLGGTLPSAVQQRAIQRVLSLQRCAGIGCSRATAAASSEPIQNALPRHAKTSLARDVVGGATKDSSTTATSMKELSSSTGKDSLSGKSNENKTNTAAHRIAAWLSNSSSSTTLRFEQLTTAPVSYVVCKGMHPEGRLKVPLAFASLYAVTPTLAERERLWTAYYLKAWREAAPARTGEPIPNSTTRPPTFRILPDKNEYGYSLVSKSCIERFYQDLGRLRSDESEVLDVGSTTDNTVEETMVTDETKHSTEAHTDEDEVSASALASEPDDTALEGNDSATAAASPEAEDAAFLDMLSAGTTQPVPDPSLSSPGLSEAHGKRRGRRQKSSAFGCSTREMAVLRHTLEEVASSVVCDPSHSSSVLIPPLIPPPLFYWELYLCGEQHNAFIPVPDISKYVPQKAKPFAETTDPTPLSVLPCTAAPPGEWATTTTTPLSTPLASLWIPVALLAYFPLLRRVQTFQRVRQAVNHKESHRSQIMKKPHRGAEDDCDDAADEMEEEDRLEAELQLQDLEGLERHESEMTERNPTPPCDAVERHSSERWRKHDKSGEKSLYFQFTSHSDCILDPLTAFPLFFYWWKWTRTEFSLQCPHTSALLAPSLTKAQSVYVMGSGYFINVNDTILSSIMDSSFCAQYCIPLTETGDLFVSAIRAVQDVSVRPLNYLSWTPHRRRARKTFRYRFMQRRKRPFVSSSASFWRKERKSDETAGSSSAPTPVESSEEPRKSLYESTPAVRADKPETMRIPAIPSMETEIGSTPSVAKEKATPLDPPSDVEPKPITPITTSTNNDLWLEKMRAAQQKEMVEENKLIARAAQRQEKKTSGLASSNAPDDGRPTPVLHASRWRAARPASFGSPYWIAVDTLEKRWGVTVNQHRETTFLYIQGRKYVNAESTSDASRFNPLTCTPNRLHQILTFHGIRTCSWEFSDALREAYDSPSPHSTTPSGCKANEEGWNLWVSLRLVRAAGWEVREGALLVHLDAEGSRRESPSRIAKTSYYEKKKGFQAYLFAWTSSSTPGSGSRQDRRISPRSQDRRGQRTRGGEGAGPWKEASTSNVWEDPPSRRSEKKISRSTPSSYPSGFFSAKCFTDPDRFQAYLTELEQMPETMVNAADMEEGEAVTWLMSYAPAIFLRSPRRHTGSDNAAALMELSGSAVSETSPSRFLFPVPSDSGGDGAYRSFSKDQVHPQGHNKRRWSAGARGGGGAHPHRVSVPYSEALHRAYMEQSRQLHTCLSPASRVLLALFAYQHGYTKLETPRCSTVTSIEAGSTWMSKRFLEDEPAVSVLDEPSVVHPETENGNGAHPRRSSLPNSIVVAMRPQPIGRGSSPSNRARFNTKLVHVTLYNRCALVINNERDIFPLE